LNRECKNSDDKKMIAKSEAEMLPNFLGHLNEEKGATAVEYALLATLIATVIAGTVALIGPALVPGFIAVIAGL
jgi:Flp pilus assembly pilin Flp